MSRIRIAIIVLIILSISAYLYVRYSVLKAKDFKPDNSKAATPLDLRPSLIAKLQQLVKDGWRMRVYIPFGTEWYPYFMRRLGERPANVFFIARNLLRS